MSMTTLTMNANYINTCTCSEQTGKREREREKKRNIRSELRDCTILCNHHYLNIRHRSILNVCEESISIYASIYTVYWSCRCSLRVVFIIVDGSILLPSDKAMNAYRKQMCESIWLTRGNVFLYYWRCALLYRTHTHTHTHTHSLSLAVSLVFACLCAFSVLHG
jgi:hypothetical protein